MFVEWKADWSVAYEIRLGTVDQTEADVEWLLRPYQRTAKKRTEL
jgi:U3 small nucleolar ribonucleoprotein protein IMP4